MQNIEEIKAWKKLEKQVKMIVVEMECLHEIYGDFSKILSMRRKELTKLKKYDLEISKLKASTSSTVGFFKKKPKEEKISDLLRNSKES